MKIRIKHRLSVAAAGLMFAVIVAAPTLAIGPVNSHANAHAASLPPQASNAGQGSSQAATHQADAQAKLAAVQLKACQNRQEAITNIMARIADRGQKQLDLFTTIANRVEAFYTKEGKTLSNYDSLVTDVNTEKAAAQTAVDNIKSDDTGFDCSSSNPKAFVETFQGSLKTEISALQAYKTSVKNLIVGVKSVVGTTSSASNDSGSTNPSTPATGGNQ